jgi:hypothetical protein
VRFVSYEDKHLTRLVRYTRTHTHSLSHTHTHTHTHTLSLSHTHTGHNRLATVFFYLTSVEEGGHTVFPYGNTPEEDQGDIHAYGPCEDALPTALKVAAVEGHAIIFYHMDPKGQLEGKLDKTSLHGG